MLTDRAAQIAREQMKNGQNCCQSVILATGQVFNIPVSKEMIASASLFSSGMESGCSCGALVGMVMFSGVLQKHADHPLGHKLAQKLHDDFKAQFGSTCCRVIRKRRSALQNIGNRACIDLTSQAAAMLVKEWEGLFDDAQHIDPDTYPK